MTKIFLSAQRDIETPPAFTAAAEWLGKLGDVYIQNAGGGRKALHADLQR